ncbi:verrucotoxin subunit beta-like [Garra rufa]|uniref:verrucotoxin subunit beta-like n=1 Tax=Garra rufa TaxID=137080 RepID=UPI003CCEBD6A
MASLLVCLKQPNRIYICVFLCLAYLAVGNAKAILQPKADEIEILTEETIGAHRGIRVKLLNLILYLNGSDFEIEEVKNVGRSHRSVPSETHHIEPAYPKPKTPTYRTNDSNRLPSPKSPVILQSSAAVLSPQPHRLPLRAQARKPPPLPSDTIEVAALGRPLFPGMLYDARKDSFLPGVTLWDKKSLSQDLYSRPKPHTYLKFSSSDTISEKVKLLEASTSLGFSYLAGLVEVGGSAKYLSDTKSSNHQSRITMHYSETTRYEQLTMSHLDQITYPQVFDQKTATHVVTGVEYGAQAFMVFDRTLSEEESKQSIRSEMDALIRKIPKLSAEGNAAFQMTYTEKKMAEKITCTFHGDVRLQQNPTTFMEALNVYKQLPALLKDNPQSNEVPIKVWLHPLHLLNATAARVEREISTSVAFAVKDIMERLGEAERTYKDLSENTLVNSFSDIQERLRFFISSFRIYKAMLLKAVGSVLPAVRGGTLEEKSLEDILKIHKSSPFNADTMNQWLKDAKSELDTLSSLTKPLERKIVDSDELNRARLNSDFNFVVCLAFTSLKYEDLYLSALNEFVKTDRFQELDGEPTMDSVASVKKWFEDSEIMEKMRFNTRIFKTISNAWVIGKTAFFTISAISDPSNPGSSIYLYEDGQIITKQYQKCFQGTMDCSKL